MLARLFLLLALLAPAVPLAGDTAAPELVLSDLSGRQHSLADYRGKTVVLNFWATWCIPCDEEMPLLVKLQKKYGERLVVIAVSLDDASTRAKVPEFVKRHKLKFPVLLGGTTNDVERFDLGVALPATAFLDEEGRVVGRVLGMLKKRELERRVAWMMGERQGEPPPALVNNLGN